MINAGTRCLTVAVALATSISIATSSTAYGQLGSGGFGGGPAPPSPREQKKKQYVAPQYRPTGPQRRVIDVRIDGGDAISADRIRQTLKTQPGGLFDKTTVRMDVSKLTSSGLFRDVQTFTEEQKDGVVVTFRVSERPLIGHIRFQGNKAVGEKKLQKKAEFLRQGLHNLGYKTGGSTTQIIPVIIGNEAETLILSDQLDKAGFLAIAIRPPTVPKGQSRIRLSLSTCHTQKQIEDLNSIFRKNNCI